MEEDAACKCDAAKAIMRCVAVEDVEVMMADVLRARFRDFGFR